MLISFSSGMLFHGQKFPVRIVDMIHLKLKRRLPYRPTERMNVVSYPIRDIVMEAKREEAKGKKMIYLNIGDPPQYGFCSFRVIAERVKRALDEPCQGYAPSEGDAEFRLAVSKIEKCTPDDVFVVAGLTEGIDFFFPFVHWLRREGAPSKSCLSPLPEQGQAVRR